MTSLNHPTQGRPACRPGISATPPPTRPPGAGRHPRAGLRPVILGAFVALAGLALSGCGGSSRSVAAVCHVWDTQGLALHDKYTRDGQAAQGAGLTAALPPLADLIRAPNDLATLMTQMGDVAPEPIAPDFETIASSLHKLSDSEGSSISDPLGTLASNVVNGLAVNGSYERVDQFLAANCGIPGQTAPTKATTQ